MHFIVDTYYFIYIVITHISLPTASDQFTFFVIYSNSNILSSENYQFCKIEVFSTWKSF